MDIPAGLRFCGWHRILEDWDPTLTSNHLDPRYGICSGICDCSFSMGSDEATKCGKSEIDQLAAR